MKTSELSKLIGNRVIVEWKGIQVVAKVVSIPNEFNGRDAIVQFPLEKKTHRVWASKISTLKT